MSHHFTVLHLSDLHERGSREKERVRRYRVLAESWQKNLDELLQEGSIDLVCFTGDLADWGQAKEYTAAGDLLDALLHKLGIGRERLFLVPGNHDIDRRLSKDDTKPTPEQLAFQQLRSNLHRVDPLDVSRWLAGGEPPFGFQQEWLNLTLSRQDAYREFLRGFERMPLLPSEHLHPRLGYRVAVQLPTLPFPVQIVGLDSSWLAGDDADPSRLRLTDGQVMALSRDDAGNPLPGFRLALVHHPLSDLADGARCRDLLADSVDLLLRGHLHEAALTEWTDPDRKLRSLAAGCLYEGNRADQYPNSCSVIRVVCDAAGRPRQYDVRLRSFSPRGGHWFDDGGLYRNAPSGRLTIQVVAPVAPAPQPPLQPPKAAWTGRKEDKVAQQHISGVFNQQAGRDIVNVHGGRWPVKVLLAVAAMVILGLVLVIMRQNTNNLQISEMEEALLKSFAKTDTGPDSPRRKLEFRKFLQNVTPAQRASYRETLYEETKIYVTRDANESTVNLKIGTFLKEVNALTDKRKSYPNRVNVLLSNGSRGWVDSTDIAPVKLDADSMLAAEEYARAANEATGEMPDIASRPNSSATNTTSGATVTGVTVAPLTASIAKGTTQRFTATAEFSDGTIRDVSSSATWVVINERNETHASVDSAGIATGKGPGLANVQAIFQGQTGSAEIVVGAPLMTSFSVALPDSGSADAQRYIGTFTDGTTKDITSAVSIIKRDLGQ